MDLVPSTSTEKQPTAAVTLATEQPQPSLSDDAWLSQRTGKVAVLRRNFGFVSTLGFGCLVLSCWQAAFVVLGIGLANGGPAGLVYSFVVAWVGNLAVFASLGELVSIAPTAGGQYHWVTLLAPVRCRRLLGYVAGWLTLAGWQANVASVAYLIAQLVQAFIEVVDRSYEPHLWHATLLLYASVAVAVVATTVLGRHLPAIENSLLVLYFVGFVAVLVPLVVLRPNVNAGQVFSTFTNNGGWSTQSLSFFVGLTANAFEFLGADSVYHMSEEIRNAAVVVPWAILGGIMISGAFGFAMTLIVLSCIQDLEAVSQSTYVYPFVDVLLATTKSPAGTAVIIAVFFVSFFGSIIGVTAASSRMLWAFARDRGVPGWRWVSKVNPRSSLPINSVIVTTTVCLLLGLISVGSPIAFNDVIALTLSGLYASYFMACLMLLWRRCTGAIKPFNAAETVQMTNMNSEDGHVPLVWGPWRVTEPFGTIINLFACIYLTVVFIFLFWPPAVPVTPITMNYSCLVMGAVAIVSALYYAIWAHKTYTGPVVDVAS